MQKGLMIIDQVVEFSLKSLVLILISAVGYLESPIPFFDKRAPNAALNLYVPDPHWSILEKKLAEIHFTK